MLLLQTNLFFLLSFFLLLSSSLSGPVLAVAAAAATNPLQNATYSTTSNHNKMNYGNNAIHFKDCWLLFGSVDDVGYSYSLNLARLEINRQLRQEYPHVTFESVALPNVFFMSHEERASLIHQQIASQCDLIFASSDSLLNDQHLEYATNFPNVSFLRGTGNPTFPLDYPNYREYNGNWFDAPFQMGAVAAAFSSSCAGFINAFETRGSTWSHAMGFALGYHWQKPHQPIHVITMDGYYNPEAEVLAAQQLVEQKGCDVIARHTDPNNVDQYVYSLGGSVLSMARFVDMSTFVGDTAFTSVAPQYLHNFYHGVEAVLQGVLLRHSQQQQQQESSQQSQDNYLGFYNFTQLPHEMELTPFSTAVNQTLAQQVQARAKAYLQQNNPLCNQTWRHDGTAIGDCPDPTTMFTVESYLDLDNVLYYDSFVDAGALCAGGQYFVYDDNMTVTCHACPPNSFADPQQRASSDPQCVPCPNGTSSPPGAFQCTKIKVTNNTTTIVIISTVSAILLWLTAMIAWWIYRRSQRHKRDNTHAPRGSGGQGGGVAVLFTDIQASTTLWAHAPQEMAHAVEVHHAILRKVIARHQGYEVKTIGDAFMITHTSVLSAVRIALDIQTELHQHDWSTVVLDEVYERMRRKTNQVSLLLSLSDSTTNTCIGNPDHWNGLRVRIGIAYGPVKAQKDAVTGGWDYYGTIVNTAARVEAAAHGGQILMTGAAHQTLLNCMMNHKESNNYDKAVQEEMFLKQFGVDMGLLGIKSHGDALLRGLSEPIELVELIPTKLSERMFAPLRLDADPTVLKNNPASSVGETCLESSCNDSSIGEAEDGGDDEDELGELPAMTQHDQRTRLIHQALRVIGVRNFDDNLVDSVREFHDGLQSVLTLYTPAERKKLLDQMLHRWHLSVPSTLIHKSDSKRAIRDDTDEDGETKMNLSVLMLAVRATTVSRARKEEFLVVSSEFGG